MIVPAIEKSPDGWYSQRWVVGIDGPSPTNTEELSRELEHVTLSALVDDWVERGEKRRDPVRVRCRVLASGSLEVVIEVRSEHPDWRMGAYLATLQEVDRRLVVTHLQDVPRADIKPWYLAHQRGTGKPEPS